MSVGSHEDDLKLAKAKGQAGPADEALGRYGSHKCGSVSQNIGFIGFITPKHLGKKDLPTFQKQWIPMIQCRILTC